MAMNSCIDKGVLKDILLKSQAEVMHMLLTEYDEKKHMKAIRKEGYEEGRYDLLMELIQNKLKMKKCAEIIAEELGIEMETVKEMIQKITSQS